MPYNPKTSWTPQDAPGPSDFNRIEQGIADATVAAEVAQAAAETAQQTADTALSTAQAAQNTANTASQAISSHASAAAPHSGHAKLSSENTFTAKNTFAAGVQLGDANSDLIDVMGLVVPLNTHSKQVTAWDSAFPEKPKTIQIKDGSTVMATIEVISRNSEGKVTQLRITQGGRTRTWNITWTSGREFPDSVTVS